MATPENDQLERAASAGEINSALVLLMTKPYSALNEEERAARTAFWRKGSWTQDEKVFISALHATLRAKLDEQPQPLAVLAQSVSISTEAVKYWFTADCLYEMATGRDLMDTIVAMTNADRHTVPMPIYTGETRAQMIAAHAELMGKEAAEELFRNTVTPGAEGWQEIGMLLATRTDWPTLKWPYPGGDAYQDNNVTRELIEDMLKTELPKELQLRPQASIGPDGTVRITYELDKVLLPDTLFALIALLLWDDALPYGRNLCRCRLNSCRRFFFATKQAKGGPPRRTFCTNACMKAAHGDTAAARVRKSRERKKERLAAKLSKRRHK